jgi:hypothetical protein
MTVVPSLESTQPTDWPPRDPAYWQGLVEQAEEDACRGEASSDQEAITPFGAVQQSRHPSLPNSRAEAPKICATPFRYRDPSLIPPRRWLYAKHMIRGFVSATIAPGGIGKSSLLIGEALAIASGRPLLGILPTERTAVWLWSEDPYVELERRVTTSMQCLGVRPEEIEGYLYVDSGRTMPIKIAVENRGQVTLNNEVVSSIVRTILDRKIGLAIFDPLLSTHSVSENNNLAMDVVIKDGFCQIAEQTGGAIELIQHTRKTGSSEVSIEDARGASAFIGAVRSARTLQLMSKDEAARFNVADPKNFFRVNGGKANMAAVSDSSAWYEKVGVSLANGDEVVAVRRWQPPGLFDDVPACSLAEVKQRLSEPERWWYNHQSKNWIGELVGEILGLDARDPDAKEKIKAVISTWIKSGELAIVKMQDNNRKVREAVICGPGAN